MFDFIAVEVHIQGATPMLMNRITNEDLEKPEGRIQKGQAIKRTPQEEAARRAHVSSDGKTLILPERNVRGCLSDAAKKGKWAIKVGRFSTGVQNLILGLMDFQPLEIPLVGPSYKHGPYNEDTLCTMPIKDLPYQIDRRPGRIPGGGMIVVTRPLIAQWSLSFICQWQPEDFGANFDQTLKDIVDYAGKRVGLGAYRPGNPKSGTFGKFEVKSFQVMETPKQKKAA